MLYPAELRARALPAASTPGPVVGPVLRFWTWSCLVRRTYVRFIETVTVSVCTLTAVYFVQKGSVLLGFSALPVLFVLLLVVSFLELHGTNIINCWGGGT